MKNKPTTYTKGREAKTGGRFSIKKSPQVHHKTRVQEQVSGPTNSTGPNNKEH